MQSQLVSYILLHVFAVLLTAAVLPGFKVTNLFGLLCFVIGLAVINRTIWDAALFFSIPDSWSNRTLVIFGCNAVLFLFLVKILPGVEVSGIISCLLAPVLWTIFAILIDYGVKTYLPNVSWNQVLGDSAEFIRQLRSNLLNSK